MKRPQRITQLLTQTRHPMTTREIAVALGESSLLCARTCKEMRQRDRLIVANTHLPAKGGFPVPHWGLP